MVLLLIFLLFSWKWALFSSFFIGFSGILSQFISRFADQVLLYATQVIGKLMQTLLISILFFFILCPVSFIYRIFNRDPLMLSRKYKSLFIDSNKHLVKGDFEKTW
jgi:hypothetical protein